ncbi:MAG: flagellar basal body-associated FliL family protein [Deltaproteobacteria bacterium]|nr:flagellar basal body-associated FliL family protein [Deltaproteobacteria bacterium]
MAKKKEAEVPDEGQEVKKSKKGLLIIIILVVLLLGGGGFGAYWFLLRTPAPTAEELAAQEAARKPEPVILPVFALKPFVVNLADKKSRRYLKVTMKLELSNPELLEEVEKRQAQIRDVVLTLLSSKTADEISTMEGKFLLRQDIIKRVNVNLVTGKITKIYWEEFVVQ